MYSEKKRDSMGQRLRCLSPEKRVQVNPLIDDNIKRAALKDTDMSQSYSKDEIDLKLENLEQRLDSKLDLVLTKVELGFSHFNTRLDDFWKIFIGISVATLLALLVLIFQNSHQQTQQPSVNVYQQPTASTPVKSN